MNNDGKLTVTDVSLLIKKIENKRDYEVELLDIDTKNYYPNKNEELEISFIEKINYDDVTIEKLIVNNNEYEVKPPDENNNKYSIKLNVGDKIGKQDLEFSKAILNTGEEVKIDYVFSISVLKERPFIDEKQYKLEDTFEGKAKISFDLIV